MVSFESLSSVSDPNIKLMRLTHGVTFSIGNAGAGRKSANNTPQKRWDSQANFFTTSGIFDHGDKKKEINILSFQLRIFILV